MKRTIRWMTLFVLLLSLMALACGLGGGEEPAATLAPAATEPAAEEPTKEEMPAATQPATATEAPAAAPTEAPAAEAGAAMLDTAALANAGSMLEQHNSYHAVITMNFEGTADDGTPVNTVMNMDMVNVINPPASRFAINLSGVGEEVDSQVIEVTTIGDTVYTSMTGLGCFSGSAADMGGFTDSFDSMISPEQDLVSDLEKARYVGEETHNGFVSDCYAFDQNDMPAGFEDAETLDGLVCLSKEYGFISHITLNATGVSDQFSGGAATTKGNMTLTYEITELDEVAELTIPADCQIDAADSQWPILEDATNVSTFQGITIYSTMTPFADVVSFYQDEMAAAGYQPSGDPAILGETSAILDFTSDAGSVSVTITSIDDSGSLQVLISPSE